MPDSMQRAKVMIIGNELVRALWIFVGGSFVLEFMKEGLVSNIVDLHIFLIAAIGLYLMTLLLPKSKME